NPAYGFLDILATPSRSRQMSIRKLVCSVLSLVAILHGQTSTGQIDFTVQDSSGGVVPGASITVTGADTGNLARALSTNDSGLAEAPLLRPGTYDVTVSVKGFEKL